LLSILKRENRNDKTYFVFNFGSLLGIYIVLLDQHNGLKNHHPEIKITMGGGFPNTELFSIRRARF
jgi:hypothetical protein